MTDLIALFPGQGSQHSNMLMDFTSDYPVIEQTFREGSDAIGIDLSKIIKDEDASALNLTQNTQPILLAASIGVWRLLQQELGEFKPAVAAGHSLGEYSALCAAGAIEFRDAIKLVRSRGELMDKAVPAGEGGMVALLGLSLEQVEDLCTQLKQANSGVTIEPANINAPGQIVVAGCAKGLDLMIEKAKDAGAKRALKLNVSGPFHSSLMRKPAESFAELVQAINWQEPTFPVIHNASNQVAQASSIAEQLTKQLYSPVNWIENFTHCCNFGTQAIEVGSAKVLAGLNRRINKEVRTLTTDSKDSFEKSLATIKETA